MALERGPRSVQHVRRGLLLGGRSHRRQWVFFGRRGGERRQLAANKARAPDARVLTKTPRVLGDTSFTRSEGLCTSILAQRNAGQLAGGQADEVSSRSGKPGQPGGTGTEEMASRTERSSPRIDALAREAARCGERKGRWSRPPSLRGKRESRSKCPYVVAVAEVGKRTSGLEYARAQGPEKGDGASERGPSSEPSSAVKRR